MSGLAKRYLNRCTFKRIGGVFLYELVQSQTVKLQHVYRRHSSLVFETI